MHTVHIVHHETGVFLQRSCNFEVLPQVGDVLYCLGKRYLVKCRLFVTPVDSKPTPPIEIMVLPDPSP